MICLGSKNELVVDLSELADIDIIHQQVWESAREMLEAVPLEREQPPREARTEIPFARSRHYCWRKVSRQRATLNRTRQPITDFLTSRNREAEFHETSIEKWIAKLDTACARRLVGNLQGKRVNAGGELQPMIPARCPGWSEAFASTREDRDPVSQPNSAGKVSANQGLS